MEDPRNSHGVHIFGQQPSMHPPLWLQQWQQRRIELMEAERHHALHALDPDGWKLYCIRWDVQQGPHGFGTPDQLRQIMHIVRLTLMDQFTAEECRHSCEWLIANGHSLPKNWIRDSKGKFKGTPLPKAPVILKS